jgi:hypothetical protein
MTAEAYSHLAAAVLLFHLLVVLFNLFGMIVIPLGAWRGWAFVRVFWWRALHLAVLALVALQAVLGQACFLTVWQSELLRRAGEAASDAPFIARFINRLLFWPLPPWVFALAYVAVCAYALALWRLVPPARRRPAAGVRQIDSRAKRATRGH